MRLIEWEVNEDNYQEQINIPSEQRKMAAEEGISTDYKRKVAVQITSLSTGEMYTARSPITGANQIYVLVEIQKMLEDSGRIRIQILGG